ncbi:MAG: hypothetical protein NWE93_12890 [Candidatus Bathyarchaeota archaeon]|nr:hypothetical protein [Candidatus Bathyarchaeota archaeon]
MSRTIAFALIAVLVASSLVIAGPVSAQTLKPEVNEFRLQYVDSSYDVAPSPTFTKDLYTGETITTTIPGYRVENKSIVATIKNPSGVDAYNFRWKPHNESRWYYHPFDTEADQTPSLSASGFSGPPAYASDSEYTVITVISVNHISGALDVQVQALYGDYRATHNTPIQIFEGDFYDYYFDGQASYWSQTETIDTTNGQTYITPTSAPKDEPTTTATATPSENSTAPPTQVTAESGVVFELNGEDVALVSALAVITVLAAALVLLWRKRK